MFAIKLYIEDYCVLFILLISLLWIIWCVSQDTTKKIMTEHVRDYKPLVIFVSLSMLIARFYRKYNNR